MVALVGEPVMFPLSSIIPLLSSVLVKPHFVSYHLTLTLAYMVYHPISQHKSPRNSLQVG